MRYRLGLLLIGFCFLTIPAWAQATLSPAAPVANQGQSITITASGSVGTGSSWTCPGCAGTLSGATATTVIYTAPATITPQQSIGGYQLHPNNHVYNTRIDSLALRSDSATLMAGTGTANITFVEVNDIPLNYTNASTPLVPMSFLFTSGNNGNFQIPSFPNAGMQSGWLAGIQGAGGDHHIITVDTTNGLIEETYDYLPSCVTTGAAVSSNVATLTCSANPSDSDHGFVVGNTVEVTGFSGADTYFNIASVVLTAVNSTSISYPLTHANASASTNGVADRIGACAGCNAVSGIKYNYSDYTLPAGVSADAAGLEIAPLLLRLQEMKQAIATGGTINHALRMTLANGFICNSNSAGACYTGKPAGIRHIWPATSEAFAGGGLNPYGIRYRLKAAFNISTFSPIAQILLTQMKQYGLILSDGGTNWAIAGEAGSWPPEIASAFYELSTAGIQGSTNFEVVDEDPLKIVSTSGETTNNRETVTYTSSTGVATVDVALMGVAVAVPNNALYFQDGVPVQQLAAFSNIGSVTWTMNPPVGVLTSGGLYTAPSADASFTQEADSDNGNANDHVAIEDKNVSATGSYTATARYVFGLNSPPPAEWQMYMLALKSAGAPFGAPPVQTRLGDVGTCSNTCTGGFSPNATTGNVGIIAVYEKDTTATISSTSFACGTLTLDSNSPKRGAASSMWVYTVQLTSGTCGTSSIGITFNHSVSGSISTTEYHNMASSNVVDCSGSGSATSFSPSTSSCSTSNANDTIWAISLVPCGYNGGCGGIAYFMPGGYYTTATATSTTNASVAASLLLVTLPPTLTGIHIRPGVFTPSLSNPVFTDSHGVAWLPTGGDTISGQRFTDLDIATGGSFPAVTDIDEYYFFKSFADVHYTFYVPNGKYQITAKCATGGGVGTSFVTFATQGQISLADADVNVRAGGSYKPVDFVSIATVTNNILDFANFGSRLGGNNPLNALQIVPLGTTLTPGMKVTPGMTIK